MFYYIYDLNWGVWGKYGRTWGGRQNSVQVLTPALCIWRVSGVALRAPPWRYLTVKKRHSVNYDGGEGRPMSLVGTGSQTNWPERLWVGGCGAARWASARRRAYLPQMLTAGAEKEEEEELLGNNKNKHYWSRQFLSLRFSNLLLIRVQMEVVVYGFSVLVLCFLAYKACVLWICKAQLVNPINSSIQR